jgi:acetaldehyde dehydrogenase/alcohol dehydrogenase
MLNMDRIEQYADDIVGRAWQAAESFRSYTQDQVDRIVEAVFVAAYDARLELARLAHEETGMGLYEHKVVKNAWASLLVYEDIRDRRTVGVVAHDEASGITAIAQPKGPILATIPVTNPTSTTIFKILVCMKSRNPVILSPHRAARKCIRRTAEILRDAAAGAGAPPDAVQWITQAESAYLDAVLRHRKLALALATGTAEIVRRVQASGTPTLGVGPGNVPVYVHASADLELAARTIVHSKTFDNGVVCASEQALVVEPDVDQALRPLLAARGAWFCTPEQMQALGPVCYDRERRTMRADVVGRPAAEIAARAGFAVPPGARLLVASPAGIGPEHPLSHEILAPVLAHYCVPDYATALRTCEDLNRLGGVGHTVSLFATDERVLDDFARMNAGRIVVNTPSTEGAIGGIFNGLKPSLTLACGTGAGNLDTDNITVEHLLNIHRVARRRLNPRWLGISRATWLDAEVGSREIRRLYAAGAGSDAPTERA